MEPDRDVLITDVVLRDGLRDEPIIVAAEDRVRLGRLLLGAGLGSLEVGAFVSTRMVPQMAGTDAVLHILSRNATAALHPLVFTEFGAQQAVEAGARSVRFVVSATERHSRVNAGATTAGALDRLAPAAEVLRDAGVTIEASIAAAFVSPLDDDAPPVQVARTAERFVQLGADVVHLEDTGGAAHPHAITRGILAVRDAVPGVPLGLHLHDTHGMAAANAWAAFRLGIRRFDAALGGIGGCPFGRGASGNIATEELVRFFHREGVRTGIDPVKLAAARDLLVAVIGHPLRSALSHMAKPRVGVGVS